MRKRVKREPVLHIERIKSIQTCAREMCSYLQRMGQVCKKVHYFNWWHENSDLVSQTWNEIKTF